MKSLIMNCVLLIAVSPLMADDLPQLVQKLPKYTKWPFDQTEALQRQAETSKAIESPVVLKMPLDNQGTTVLNWRLIPAGTFTMGSPRNEPGHEGDERLRTEIITHPFYMMETQLTVKQYQALLDTNPPIGPKGQAPGMPAGVMYRDAVDNVLPALASHAPRGWKIILPDQVRLEYAARAGVSTMNQGGNRASDAANFAWTKENSEGKVHPVGLKRPNSWGLYDVIGNQWHWFWRLRGNLGDRSADRHIVYGGSYRTPAEGNGARLANIRVSSRPEGVRFALILENDPLPEGHPGIGN